MLAAVLKLIVGHPSQPGLFKAGLLLVLSVCALASFVLGTFLLAGAWGFLALGVALAVLEWRVDSTG